MRTGTALVAGVVTCWIVASQAPAQPPGPVEGPGGFRGSRMGPLDPPRLPVMGALDANGDGQLSADEIAAASEALKKLDKNNDGTISREELRPQFGGRGGPGGPGGVGGMPPFRSGQSASFDTSPLAKDDAEQRILKALQEIPQKQGRMMNVPPQDGRMLRLLAEAIGAKTAVEIGTSNGLSAIWLCLALRKTGGKLITHEIDKDVAALARENLAIAGVADLVTIVEGDAHETVSRLTGPIDLVFIDADKEGYVDYLRKLLPLVRPGGLILAHNINPRMANPQFVQAITTNPELETVFYLEGGGLSVTIKKR